jgi:hypothetical protein
MRNDVLNVASRQPHTREERCGERAQKKPSEGVGHNCILQQISIAAELGF